MAAKQLFYATKQTIRVGVNAMKLFFIEIVYNCLFEEHDIFSTTITLLDFL